MPRAGQLRHRVTLQSASTTRDDYGGRTPTWEDVATVWAEVEALRGTEQLRAMQVGLKQPHRIRMRYRAGVTGAMRAVHHHRDLGNVVHHITSVADPDGRRRDLELLTEVRS